MFWQEQPPETHARQAQAVLVSLAVEVAALPVDHGLALSEALLTKLPDLAETPCAGIHTIYGAESGNGWERACGEEDVIYPSRRTRLQLQVPMEMATQVMTALDGFETDICGERLRLSKPAQKQLLKHHTVFARFVVSKETDEDAFLHAMYQQFAAQGIEVKKMMCGKSHHIQTGEGRVETRSLMLADLKLGDALMLQSCGIGAHKLLGCGLFLPHKTVEDTWSNTQ